MLWMSLTTGAVLGALSYGRIGGAALWVGAGVSAGVAALLAVRDRKI
jgi:uncharacterized membrane protein YoaK (UPF0700 family)